jgi:phage terminase large subunit
MENTMFEITDNETEISFPPKFYPMLNPMRFKILYGGRCSGKSVSFAKLLLTLGTQKPLRILCIRHVLQSMTGSVKKLLADQIHEMGLDYFYEIQRDLIRGRNDPLNPSKCTEIRFMGCQNADSIRSQEGTDICWLEEAHDITKEDLLIIIPTIRKKGSEIWASFNPRLASDEIYKRMVMNPPPNATVIRMNYLDNPWIEDTELMEDIRQMKEDDYDQYQHVYLGACITTTKGSIYSKQIKKAEVDGRFTRVPPDPRASIIVSLDYGYADHTVAWFAQVIPGGEIHLFDFLMVKQTSALDFIKLVNEKGYVISRYYLPWDAAAVSFGSGLSVEETFRRQSSAAVQVVPRNDKKDGINAVRSAFPNLWFDSEKCEEGIEFLKMYRYKENIANDGTETISNIPVHDKASDIADSLRTLIMGIRPTKPKEEVKAPDPFGLDIYRNPRRGWMG